MPLWTATVPWPFFCQHLKTWPAKVKWPPQVKLVCSLMAPFSRAASATSGLNVEPGGKRPWMTLFCKGWDGSVAMFFQYSREPDVSWLGSKAGWLTRASMPPVRGSETTAPPFFPSRAFSIVVWTFEVDIEVDAVAGDGLLRVERPYLLAGGVHLDPLLAVHAPQILLVHPLQGRTCRSCPRWRTFCIPPSSAPPG